MTEKLKQTIKENLVNLPKESQDTINSFDWGKISEEIGKKYLLTDNEINNLQIETGLVLIGLIRIDKFSFDIENEIGTSKNEAEKITEEIYLKIFKPISETIIRKIKENLKTKNPNWKQTLNFIISGGDYSVFMERGDNSNTNTEIPKTTTLDNSKK
jgi:hypothetical protein